MSEIVWGCNIRTGKTINGKDLVMDDNKVKEILKIVFNKLNDKEAFMFGCFLKASRKLLEAKK